MKSAAPLPSTLRHFSDSNVQRLKRGYCAAAYVSLAPRGRCISFAAPPSRGRDLFPERPRGSSSRPLSSFLSRLSVQRRRVKPLLSTPPRRRPRVPRLLAALRSAAKLPIFESNRNLLVRSVLVFSLHEPGALLRRATTASPYYKSALIQVDREHEWDVA
jgi:hypothetical protein